MTTTTYTVSGLTCGHCVSAVAEEIKRLPSVGRVDVDLMPGSDSLVAVTSDAELTEADVRAAVDQAGYQLTGVV